MRHFNKKLVAVAAASGLMAVIGATWAQAPVDPDPMSTPQTAADGAAGNHILHFADQGNSPETDPSAHLILIKEGSGRVAQAPVETTTVAQADPAPTYTAPATTDSSSSMSNDTPAVSGTETSTASDTSNAMPAPRADRN